MIPSSLLMTEEEGFSGGRKEEDEIPGVVDVLDIFPIYHEVLVMDLDDPSPSACCASSVCLPGMNGAATLGAILCLLTHCDPQWREYHHQLLGFYRGPATKHPRSDHTLSRVPSVEVNEPPILSRLRMFYKVL